MQERTATQPREAPAGVAQTAVAGQGSATPTEVLEAFRAQRGELRDQMRRLENDREEIVREIERGLGGEANQKALDQRLASIDQRISTLDQQLAQADAQVAQASAIPGAVQPPPPPPYRPSNDGEEVAMLGLVVTGVLLFPIMIAWTRRIWRRSARVVTAIPDALMERFGRLEHAVDSIAIEVERIGEGQRFMTRVLAEHGSPREAIPASLTDELNLPPGTSSRGRR